MKKTTFTVIGALLLTFLLTAGGAVAQETPVGLWKSVDDATGKGRSFVRITEVDGALRGLIEKIILQWHIG